MGLSWRWTAGPWRRTFWNPSVGHEKGAFTGAERKKEGLLFQARGGTLLLDEVGNLPLGLQAKLLRVLQERQVKPVGADRGFAIDVRFIAATNAPLEEEARTGRFRQDLYYRLAEFTLNLPPLRERRSDIPLWPGGSPRRPRWNCARARLAFRRGPGTALGPRLAGEYPGTEERGPPGGVVVHGAGFGREIG